MIRDNDDNPISAFTGAIAPSGVVTCTVKIDCEENRKLYADATSDFAVVARKLGDASWINIETTPIDLTPYAPAREQFEIRITAGSVSGRNGFAVTVGP